MVLMILPPVRIVHVPPTSHAYIMLSGTGACPGPWHSVSLLQRKKKFPHVELPSVDFMTLVMGHVFLLKGYIGKEHYTKWVYRN